MKHISINDPKSLETALQRLQEGGVIVYPTDTAYGLGVDATNRDAVSKIFQIKQRELGKPLPVIVSDIEQAQRCVDITDVGNRLGQMFWPGALTLVMPSRDQKLSNILGGIVEMGVRVPNHTWSRQIAQLLEGPITSTSANASGKPAEYSVEGVIKSLGDGINIVDLIVDGGNLKQSPVSTIVRYDVGSYEIVREGAISREDIEKLLR